MIIIHRSSTTRTGTGRRHLLGLPSRFVPLLFEGLCLSPEFGLFCFGGGFLLLEGFGFCPPLRT